MNFLDQLAITNTHGDGDDGQSQGKSSAEFNALKYNQDISQINDDKKNRTEMRTSEARKKKLNLNLKTIDSKKF